MVPYLSYVSDPYIFSNLLFFLSFWLFTTVLLLFSPKTRDLNLGIPFFFFQSPIPTTTTSVLSLKHKPIKFISILEAPKKFTNRQQPICCPNRWFFFFFFMGLRWERRKGRKKKRKKKERKIGPAAISSVTSGGTIYDLVQLGPATISQNQAFLFFFPSTPNTHNNHFGSELEAQTQKIH